MNVCTSLGLQALTSLVLLGVMGSSGALFSEQTLMTTGYGFAVLAALWLVVQVTIRPKSATTSVGLVFGIPAFIFFGAGIALEQNAGGDQLRHVSVIAVALVFAVAATLTQCRQWALRLYEQVFLYTGNLVWTISVWAAVHAQDHFGAGTVLLGGAACLFTVMHLLRISEVQQREQSIRSRRRVEDARFRRTPNGFVAN